MRWHRGSLGLMMMVGAVACGGSGEGGEAETGEPPSQTAAVERADCDALYGPKRWSGGANQFGQCVDVCSFELRFHERAGCRDVTLDISSWGPGAVRELLASNSGALTDQGVEKVREVSTSLRSAKLSGRYGCPDCTDGGASLI